MHYYTLRMEAKIKGAEFTMILTHSDAEKMKAALDYFDWTHVSITKRPLPLPQPSESGE